jgi:peptidoglycan hydrolase CwlO-like protein
MDVKKEEISRLLEKQRKNVKVDIAVELRAMKAMIADVEQRLNQMGKPLNEEKLKSTLSKDREIIKKSIETRASKTEDRIKSLDVRLSRSEAKVSVLDKNITAASRSKKELDDRMKKREAEIKRLLGELK